MSYKSEVVDVKPARKSWRTVEKALPELEPLGYTRIESLQSVYHLHHIYEGHKY